MLPKDRIILALDVDTQAEAVQIVKQLGCVLGTFKVGMQLYNTCGPDIVHRINDLGGKVFIDLKFHDIPNTVAAASRVMTRLGCAMFNLHAAGGKEMMKAAALQAEQEAVRLGGQAPLILAVTVLTSISQAELETEMLIKDLPLADVVKTWATMARECGMNGVVCSPQEITIIRKACGPEFKIVTPGVRPAWSEAGDQKRITTPRQALDLGADYMVIGRPILKAEDRLAAASRIIEELEA